jgi:hypothetical protein
MCFTFGSAAHVADSFARLRRATPSLSQCRSESVSRVLYPCGWRSFIWAARLLAGSSDHTRGIRAGHSPSYLVLLRVGFSMRVRLLGRRWALTPPFHPYPNGRYVFCATFRGSLRAAVNGHPALWSPDFPPLRRSDRPTHSGHYLV